MRFKLDENLGKSIQQIFQEAGHDVQTVLDEKMAIERMPIAQQVWIVEPRRIRIHQKETD